MLGAVLIQALLLHEPRNGSSLCPSGPMRWMVGYLRTPPRPRSGHVAAASNTLRAYAFACAHPLIEIRHDVVGSGDGTAQFSAVPRAARAGAVSTVVVPSWRDLSLLPEVQGWMARMVEDAGAALVVVRRG